MVKRDVVVRISRAADQSAPRGVFMRQALVGAGIVVVLVTLIVVDARLPRTSSHTSRRDREVEQLSVAGGQSKSSELFSGVESQRSSFIARRLRDCGNTATDGQWLVRSVTMSEQGITVYALVDWFSGYILCFEAHGEWKGELANDDARRSLLKCVESTREHIKSTKMTMIKFVPREAYSSESDGDEGKEESSSREPMDASGDQAASHEPAHVAAVGDTADGSMDVQHDPLLSEMWPFLFDIISCTESDSHVVGTFVEACKKDDTSDLTRQLNDHPRQKWNHHVLSAKHLKSGQRGSSDAGGSSGGLSPHALWKYGPRDKVAVRRG